MAGLIPKSFIEDLIARTDIVELVGARVELKKKGRNYTACCPFHHEKTPSFTVAPDKQFYHCFGCGAHGSALGFLIEHDHLEFVEAVEALAEFNNINPEDIPREGGGGAPKKVDDSIFAALEFAANFYKTELKKSPEAIEYVKNRGVSGETAAKFGLGFVPEGWSKLMDTAVNHGFTPETLNRAGLLSHNEDKNRFYDRFRARLMFPIRNPRGRVIGFGGRVIGEGEPKYLNSPETDTFHKGRELYGFYEARQAAGRLNYALVVEGYMDVVMLSQFGVNNAVATLGTATTTEHLQFLFRHTSKVVFCFDGDRAGREAAWRALNNALPLMQDGRDVRFLFLPDGEDPDSLVQQEGQASFEARIEREATGFSEYFIQKIQTDIPPNSAENRAALAKAAMPLLSQLPQGILKTQLFDEVARLCNVTAKDLVRLSGQKLSLVARVPRPNERQTTPGRVVIALLLQQPQMVALLDEGELALCAGESVVEVLLMLKQYLNAEPQVTTGQIIEHFREHPYGSYFSQLAVLNVHDNDENRAQIFNDALAQIVQSGVAHQIDALSSKPELNEAERALYKSLLEYGK